MNIDEFLDQNEENEFSEQKKEINTYDKPSRGRKYCPECNKYVGVRLKFCVCGFEFIAGEKHEPEKILTDKEKQERRYIINIVTSLSMKICQTRSLSPKNRSKKGVVRL